MNARLIIEIENEETCAAVYQAVEAGILELRQEYKLRYREAGFTLDTPSRLQDGRYQQNLNQIVYTGSLSLCSAWPAAAIHTHVDPKGSICIRASNIDMRNGRGGAARKIRLGSEHAFEFGRLFTPTAPVIANPEDNGWTVIVEDDGARVANALAYYGQALETILQKLTQP
jgi:hypothetical protein